MQVLQLVRCMDIGGLESVVAGLGAGLVLSGEVVYLGCLSHRGSVGDVGLFSGEWVGGLRASKKFLDVRCLISLCRYIRANKIDVIHSHNPQPLVYGALASLLTGVPVVHTIHGRGYDADPHKAKKGRFRRLFSGVVKKYVAVSRDVGRKLVEIDAVRAEKVVVIPNGVRIKDEGGRAQGRSAGAENLRAETRMQKREELGISSEAFVIGAVGRLAEEKNYGLLIEAFGELVAKFQVSGFQFQPCLLLVGDGPERESLEARAKSKGLRIVSGREDTSAFRSQLSALPSVIIAGMQSDVGPYYSAMDVFCLPSLTEGMAMTLLEAGAAGLPCIVTDVGGNAEIVKHGETGLVVESLEVNALKLALQQLAEDEALRKGMGEAASMRISEKFSIDAMVRKYMHVYIGAGNE